MVFPETLVLQVSGHLVSEIRESAADVGVVAEHSHLLTVLVQVPVYRRPLDHFLAKLAADFLSPAVVYVLVRVFENYAGN